jgi:hypothetical protein
MKDDRRIAIEIKFVELIIFNIRLTLITRKNLTWKQLELYICNVVFS